MVNIIISVSGGSIIRLFHKELEAYMVANLVVNIIISVSGGQHHTFVSQGTRSLHGG